MEILDNIYFYTFSSLYLIFLLLFGITMIMAVFNQIPFVPTPRRIAKKLIEIADIKKGQTVYDLGCGDGRLLFIASAKQQINAVGFEISPIPYVISKIKKFFLKSNVQIKLKNLFKEDLSNADIIFVYLIPDIMPKLASKIKSECKKGTKIISHTFKIADMKPKKIYEKNKKDKLPVIYLYEV